ncbi:hypothetical protein PTKIN_Ptkin19aG0038300 [Pterospermum kingtungense]
MNVQIIGGDVLRSRKGDIVTKVLGVCTPNMHFIYVLPGWKGSAVDGRMLRDAISCYYLCDAGYSNGDGFLAPYRGQRSEMESDPMEEYVSEESFAEPSGKDEDIGYIMHYQPSTEWTEFRDKLANDIGFEWNEVEKCVTAPKDVCDDWIRDDFLTIFGKDRATGQGQYDTTQVENDVEVDVATSTIHPKVGKATQSIGKKKAKTSEGNNLLVNHVVRFHDAYKKTTEQIKGIASFFIKEMEATDR